MTRFWTVLQHPFHEAVLVDGGKIVRRVPDHPVKTLSRRVGCIGEYDGRLVIVRHASVEFWDRRGIEMEKSFHHRSIYAPHRIVQHGDFLLLCSSGLDLFLMMDACGETKWEWWGFRNGNMGGRPDAYFEPNWETVQTTSDRDVVDRAACAHYNSIWMVDAAAGVFLTSALRKQRVIIIRTGEDGFEHVAWTPEPSVHSPFFDADETLVYGTDRGVRVGGGHVLEHLEWVKFVEPLPDGAGHVITHDAGVAVADRDWRIVEEAALPKPFQVAFFER